MLRVPIHVLKVFAASAFVCLNTDFEKSTMFTSTPVKARAANPSLTATQHKKKRSDSRTLLSVSSTFKFERTNNVFEYIQETSTKNKHSSPPSTSPVPGSRLSINVDRPILGALVQRLRFSFLHSVGRGSTRSESRQGTILLYKHSRFLLN